MLAVSRMVQNANNLRNSRKEIENKMCLQNYLHLTRLNFCIFHSTFDET